MRIFIITALIIFSINTAFAQNVGDVLRYKKIGNNTGNLGNVLSDNSYFGVGLANIGDVNGDGIPDMAAGIHGKTPYGGVYILFMDTNGTVQSKKLLAQNTNGIGGLQSVGYFGCAISTVGDINSDGVPDIAVGALGEDNNRGAIHIICLNSSGVAISQQRISATTGVNAGGGISLQNFGHFGCDIDYLGDLNNDGNIEIAVGNSWDDQSGQNFGALWILSINSNKKVTSSNKIRKGVSNFSPSIGIDDYFGQSVCGIGDFDGDGINDLAAGAVYDDDGNGNAGAVYIIHLNSNSTVKNYTKISNSSFTGTPISGTFGTAIAVIPDITGDGHTDLAIGAPRYPYAGDWGAVYIVKFGANEVISGLKKITQPEIPNPSQSRLGRSLCCLNDYNSDGEIEIVSEAPYENSGKGMLYIMSIKTALNTNISASSTLCPGDSTGMAIANGSGPNPPFTYLWSNGSTNDTISNIPAGTYSVTMTNSLGSTTTSNVTVSGPSAMTITKSANATICEGTNIALTAIGNGGTGTKTIHWDNGLSNANAHIVSPSINTTYSIYATDANNCISDTSQIIISVNSLPTPSFSGLNTAYCSNDNSTTLSGLPSGGSFAGSGISGSVFDPNNANTGNVDIIYSYTDANGCVGKDTNSTNIIAAPNVVFNGISSAYCTNDGGFALSTKVTPSGGSFFVNNISSTHFIPSSLGAGTYKIKYNVTNSSGCSDLDSISTFINPAPTASFSGLAAAYCENDASVSLTGNPSGGSFTGSGISGNSFSPASAGTGYTSVIYSYSNMFGCSDTAIHATTINTLTSISVSTIDTVFCNSDALVSISTVPNGGVLSGVAVNNTSKTFDPTSANIGNNSIIYTFTNSYGCVSTDNYSVVVNTPANLSISGLSANYCVNNNAATISGSPSGGVFYGSGISGNSFNPNVAGIGSHTVSYKYDNGCEDTAHQIVVINSLPVVSISGLATDYCVNEASASLSGLPIGGSFMGSGISGNSFNPSNAGVGSFAIKYISSADANGCIDTATENVVVNNIPSISFGALVADACINNSAIAINATPNGGSYAGSFVSTGNFYPNNAGIGNHKVFYSFSDNNSCSNTDSFTFVVHNLPSINFTTATSCANIASISLSASPSGGSFSGNNVSGNSFMPSLAGAGAHDVVYSFTDNYSCTNTDTQSIIIYSIPNIVFNIANNDYCVNGSSINLSASPSGGSFSGNGISVSSFNPSVAGIGSHDIIYTATDANSCSNSDTNTLIVHALPIISISNFNANNCINNDNDTINALPYGGSLIGAGMSDSIFSPYSAGIGTHKIKYYFTDAFGCNNIDSISINVFANPSITIISGLNTQYCKNDTAYALSLTPAGGVFNANFIVNDTFYPNIAPSGHIGYIYSFTDANGCSDNIHDSTYVYNNPIVNAGNNTTIPCNSMGVVIGEGSYTNTTYLWSPYLGLSNPFVSNPTANPLQNTVYTLIKTDLATNCSSVDSVEISIPNDVVVEISGDTIICFGDSVHLFASGADTLKWKYGSMGSYFDALLPISQYISVYGIDSNNCTDADSVIIILNPLPQPYIGEDTAIFDNQVLILDAGIFAAYQWNTGQISQTINVEANVLSAGNYNYSVKVENSNGCFGSDTIVISITTGIETIAEKLNVRVFPNPSKGMVNIEWNRDADINQISVFDTYGKHIRDIKIDDNNLSTKINFSTLARGVYYLRLIGEEGSKVVKIVVE